MADPTPHVNSQPLPELLECLIERGPTPWLSAAVPCSLGTKAWTRHPLHTTPRLAPSNCPSTSPQPRHNNIRRLSFAHREAAPKLRSPVSKHYAAILQRMTTFRCSNSLDPASACPQPNRYRPQNFTPESSADCPQIKIQALPTSRTRPILIPRLSVERLTPRYLLRRACLRYRPFQLNRELSFITSYLGSAKQGELQVLTDSVHRHYSHLQAPPRSRS
jgi:hypothetical protein